VDAAGIERLSLLVVHDDPQALAQLADRLAALGHSVATAECGADALDRAAEAPPAVVLLKADLPDLHGFEVCRRLKAQHATGGAEVIFLVRPDEDLDRLAGLEAGGMDCLVEPVEDAALNARTRTAGRLAQQAGAEAGFVDKDGLTGLWNRDHFEIEFQRECNRARRYDSLFALVLLDVDDFGPLVAEHGEALGNRLLKELARILLDQTRESDCVARWGPDQFILLLPEGNLPKAIGFAKKLFAAVGQHDFRAGGRATRISVSMGVASRQNIGGRDPHDMLRLVRECLREAKSVGGDRIFYHTCGEINPVRT